MSAPTTTRLAGPGAPLAVARQLGAERYTHPLSDSSRPTLHHWRGGWWEWRESRWVEIEERAVRAVAYAFTENGEYVEKLEAKPWNPNRRKIADVLDALGAVCHLPDHISQPSWLGGGHEGPIVACENGLLHVKRRELLPHTPDYFNGTAVPFAYDPDAPKPECWYKFLADLWPGDLDSIHALQEWFGYVVSGRTDLHKILLLVGPTRGGKGTIARILGSLIGRENVAGPTLSSLSGDFGLAPLLGKSLAVISDARMSRRGSQVVVERLLAISGEDTITVNRKYRDQWTGKIPSRFVVISNELPQLGDASAAIAGRFVALLLNRSWLGKEDHDLERALYAELPGILNWSLDGLARLAESNTFTRPEATDEAIIALRDLASPVAAFVRDCCKTGAECEVAVDALWKAWKAWAEDNGHPASNRQVFGRNLKAAVPRVQVTRPRNDEARERHYVGIGLKEQT